MPLYVASYHMDYDQDDAPVRFIEVAVEDVTKVQDAVIDSHNYAGIRIYKIFKEL